MDESMNEWLSLDDNSIFQLNYCDEENGIFWGEVTDKERQFVANLKTLGFKAEDIAHSSGHTFEFDIDEPIVNQSLAEISGHLGRNESKELRKLNINCDKSDDKDIDVSEDRDSIVDQTDNTFDFQLNIFSEADEEVVESMPISVQKTSILLSKVTPNSSKTLKTKRSLKKSQNMTPFVTELMEQLALDVNESMNDKDIESVCEDTNTIADLFRNKFEYQLNESSVALDPIASTALKNKSKETKNESNLWSKEDEEFASIGSLNQTSNDSKTFEFNSTFSFGEKSFCAEKAIDCNVTTDSKTRSPKELGKEFVSKSVTPLRRSHKSVADLLVVSPIVSPNISNLVSKSETPLKLNQEMDYSLDENQLSFVIESMEQIDGLEVDEELTEDEANDSMALSQNSVSLKNTSIMSSIESQHFSEKMSPIVSSIGSPEIFVKLSQKSDSMTDQSFEKNKSLNDELEPTVEPIAVTSSQGSGQSSDLDSCFGSNHSLISTFVSPISSESPIRSNRSRNSSLPLTPIVPQNRSFDRVLSHNTTNNTSNNTFGLQLYDLEEVDEEMIEHLDLKSTDNVVEDKTSSVYMSQHLSPIFETMDSRNESEEELSSNDSSVESKSSELNSTFTIENKTIGAEVTIGEDSTAKCDEFLPDMSPKVLSSKSSSSIRGLQESENNLFGNESPFILSLSSQDLSKNWSKTPLNKSENNMTLNSTNGLPNVSKSTPIVSLNSSQKKTSKLLPKSRIPLKRSLIQTPVTSNPITSKASPNNVSKLLSKSKIPFKKSRTFSPFLPSLTSQPKTRQQNKSLFVRNILAKELSEKSQILDKSIAQNNSELIDTNVELVFENTDNTFEPQLNALLEDVEKVVEPIAEAPENIFNVSSFGSHNISNLWQMTPKTETSVKKSQNISFELSAQLANEAECLTNESIADIEMESIADIEMVSITEENITDMADNTFGLPLYDMPSVSAETLKPMPFKAVEKLTQAPHLSPFFSSRVSAQKKWPKRKTPLKEMQIIDNSFEAKTTCIEVNAKDLLSPFDYHKSDKALALESNEVPITSSLVDLASTPLPVSVLKPRRNLRNTRSAKKVSFDLRRSTRSSMRTNNSSLNDSTLDFIINEIKCNTSEDNSDLFLINDKQLV